MMGGGHCANSLAKTITSLNWHHSVTDSRREYCDSAAFPNASELIPLSVNDFLNNETFDSIKRFSDVLLLGHDWSEDQERLLRSTQIMPNNNSALDGIEFPRIGVIGSRSKWQKHFQSRRGSRNKIRIIRSSNLPNRNKYWRRIARRNRYCSYCTDTFFVQRSITRR